MSPNQPSRLISASPRPETAALSFFRLSQLILLFCLCMAPSAGANPVQTVDLAGTWDFDPDNGPATNIQVPGGGWYKQGFTSTKEADYSKTIAIPSIGQPQVTKLKFGAVNYQADLFIDGNFIASSTQSHTAAIFDITNHVTPGSSHHIRLHVKGHDALLTGSGRSLVPNGARSWANFLPQGIFRSAELLVFPQVHIEDVFVKTSVAANSLTYDVWLRNDSASTANVTLTGNLSSWNGDGWSYPALPSLPVSIPPNTTAKVTAGPVAWNLGSTSYWWPNVPYQSGYMAKLHDLNLSLTGGASHATSVRFGFRECLQQPDGMGNIIYTLNGTRVNFRGDSLQGANYDRIDNGGLGDAFSTYPGFLPGPNGWPKAVDNYQRLNYNVVRIHQIPATPYMLDICDEKGLMIIDETGIRGAGDQQDFVTGHDNMVNHLKDLFTQNRNHASIVRQSLSNEPDHSATDSEAFQLDLYNAAMEVDGTRPLSIDAAGWHAYESFDAATYPNFSVMLHYADGFGAFSETVRTRSDRPYGEGEFIWPADNTTRGFAWFGTSAQAMRAQGASDVRPYTLLSAWASVIPGTNSTDMRLENPPWDQSLLYPLYGENNLPDPWANTQIQRVQAGFHPVLVADVEYWNDNKLSNMSGAWPAKVPALDPGAVQTRTLRIYNDTFSGTAVDVHWELRRNSVAGPLIDSGIVNATVPLGYSVTQDIAFTTPNAPVGTIVYVVLSAKKGGVEMFRETSQRFVLASPQPISLINPGFEQPATGKIIGFDSATDVPGWLDVGAQSDSGVEPASIHSGAYAAFFKGRTSTSDRGVYQLTGHTIKEGDVFTIGYWAKNIFGGAEMTVVLFGNTVDTPANELGWATTSGLGGTHQYYEFEFAANSSSVGKQLGVHFVNTAGGWTALDDITLKVVNIPVDTSPPAAPAGLEASTGDGSVSLNWADNTEPDLAGYTVKRSLTSGSGYSEIASGLVASDYVDTSAINGTTYYYIVTATDVSSNESAAGAEAAATPSPPISAAEQAAPSAIYTATEARFSLHNSVPGHSYQLEVSPNLAVWSDIGVSLPGDTTTLQFVVPFDPDGNPRNFYRIEISRP